MFFNLTRSSAYLKVLCQKKFDGLAPELQKILEYASEAENSNFFWRNTLSYANDLVKLKNKLGVNVYRTPDSIMQAQLDAWDVIVKKFNATDPFFKKVVESQKGYAKKVMAYLLLNSPDYGMAYRHHFGEPTKAI